MKKLREHLPVTRAWVVAGLALMLLCAVGITACGGAGDQPDPSKADIGKTLESEGWKVTLTGLPEREPVVGTGGITNQAQGIFVIIPLTVVNENEQVLLFPQDLLKLRDTQGREFVPTGSTPQFAYLQAHPDKELLIDSPVLTGGARETILIYDVPKDAKGLIMVVKGVDDTFNLGY